MIYRVAVSSCYWGDQSYLVDADSQSAALLLGKGRATEQGIHDAVPVSASPADPQEAAREQFNPCTQCGTLRTEAEGGTIFTLCDDRYDAAHIARRAAPPPSEQALRGALDELRAAYSEMGQPSLERGESNPRTVEAEECIESLFARAIEEARNGRA